MGTAAIIEARIRAAKNVEELKDALRSLSEARKRLLEQHLYAEEYLLQLEFNLNRVTELYQGRVEDVETAFEEIE